jgi:hypothetical protein
VLIDRFGEQLLRTCPGFVNKNGRTTFPSAAQEDGYLVPYRDEEKRITGMQIKVLGGKYLSLRGSRISSIHHLAGTLVQDNDLFLTEGGVKAEVAHRLGHVNVLGVPGQALSEKHLEVVRQLQPARVIVALDSERNANTERARERWLRSLYYAGLPTYCAVWEGEDVGGPKGLDDLFQAGLRPRIRSITFPPAEIGQRRAVRPSQLRGNVLSGVSLASARQITEEAVFQFIGGR